MLHGDSFNVRDSSTHDFGGNRYKQASRSAGLDGSGVLCGGGWRCLDSWSRGKVGLVELELKVKLKCSRHIRITADGCPNEVRLSDLEPRFIL
ncbi:hypothetical protein [Bradyrhizobium sp.]|uniref:hypothetical protein n=1 Tax=Bradyrhizobium sp. TaxID=376 RepID=UPI003C582842